MFECSIDLVWVELVALPHRLAEEIESSLLRQSGHRVSWNGVHKIGESEFSLNNFLPLLALVYALLEFVWIFIKEEEGKPRDELLLAGGNNSDLVFPLLVIVGEHLYWLPAVLVALVHR